MNRRHTSGKTQGKFVNIRAKTFFGSTKKTEWEASEPGLDVQNSDGGERPSLGLEPEDGEGPGDVGDSVREIRKSQQRPWRGCPEV